MHLLHIAPKPRIARAPELVFVGTPTLLDFLRFLNSKFGDFFRVFSYSELYSRVVGLESKWRLGQRW
jgi:hypothetical protein